jgi:hypothetical protein
MLKSLMKKLELIGRVMLWLLLVVEVAQLLRVEVAQLLRVEVAQLLRLLVALLEHLLLVDLADIVEHPLVLTLVLGPAHDLELELTLPLPPPVITAWMPLYQVPAGIRCLPECGGSASRPECSRIPILCLHTQKLEHITPNHLLWLKPSNLIQVNMIVLGGNLNITGAQQLEEKRKLNLIEMKNGANMKKISG